MKFKLDENLGTSAVQTFEAAGHDTSSIHRQDLAGAPDTTVFNVCVVEQRILVTLDLDFANPLKFDPRNSSGVAVLRLSRSPSPTDLASAIGTLLEGLRNHPISGSLWVVRPDRIRVWQSENTDTDS